MDCASARTRLSPLLDDALAGDEAEAVRAHVRFCAGCSGALDGLRGVGRALKALAARPLPAGFRERLERRRAERGEKLPAYREHRRALPALAAACAALLVVVYHETHRPESEVALASAERSEAALRAKLRHDPVLPPPAPGANASPDGAADGPSLGRSLPLASAKPASAEPFDNDRQQQVLADERKKLGIQSLDAAAAPDAPVEPMFHGHIGAPENRAAVNAMVQELATASRQIREDSQLPEVPIAGRTAPVLTQSEDGGSTAEGAVADRWSGDFSSVPQGTRTIADAAQWKALWAQLSPDPAPAVDFAQRQIVGVFLGPRPTHGYGVRIVGAVATPTALVIQYTLTEPVPGRAAKDGETAPFALRAVDKSDLPVRFQKVR